MKGGLLMEADTQRYYRPGPGGGIMRLAHAYVPYQLYSESYQPEEALRNGTLYPELWMPYRAGQRGSY
jgi:hypothetical protein